MLWSSTPEPNADVLEPHDFLKTGSLTRVMVSLSLNEPCYYIVRDYKAVLDQKACSAFSGVFK